VAEPAQPFCRGCGGGGGGGGWGGGGGVLVGGGGCETALVYYPTGARLPSSVMLALAGGRGDPSAAIKILSSHICEPHISFPESSSCPCYARTVRACGSLRADPGTVERQRHLARLFELKITGTLSPASRALQVEHQL